MKFSYNWLCRHIKSNSSPQEIADGLTSSGIEVEGIENQYDYLNHFHVAIIESASNHPNADKLHVCQVFDGSKRYTVVCGAPNARAGIKVILALPGVIIPATGDKLKRGTIRGIESEGMMCSRRELMLGDEHDGIIELPDSAVIGDTAANALGLNETVFDISITPNRSDCFGIVGIAREVAAKGLGEIAPPHNIDIKKEISHDLNVEYGSDEARTACPAVATMLIRGVKNTESPDWMKKLLATADINAISAVVDVTNFVNLDLCRPLHAYDATRIHGNFVVTTAEQGLKFIDLKGKDHILDHGMVISADSTGPLCLMGIIGGERGCTSDDTTDVLLEAAIFDPSYIAKTGQKLGISTDSRTRFERGVDTSITIQALEYAASLITQICGGKASEIKIIGEIPSPHVVIQFSAEDFKRLSGFYMSDSEIRDCLTRLGFTVDGNFNVTVPSYRSDILIKEDLVEEVLRIYGYDKVSESHMEIADHITENATYLKKRFIRSVRHRLCFQGLDEALNYSFVSKRQAELFGGAELHISLANPISSDMEYLRKSLLPGLISGYQRIVNKADSISGLFEVGTVFDSDHERTMVSGIRAPIMHEKNWHDDAVYSDTFVAKADIMSILGLLDISEGKVDVTTDDLPGYYHPGVSGTLKLGPAVVGHFGQMHPAALSALDIRGRIFAFECCLDPLLKLRTKSRRFEEKKFQNVYRDFAFLAPASTPAIGFVKAVKKADAVISDVRVFDVFSSDKIGKDRVSLALRIAIEQPNATLDDAGIQKICDKVISAINKLGGEIRQ